MYESLVYWNIIKSIKQKSLEFFLESWAAAGGPNVYRRLFQAVGPATLKGCSPNFNDVRGTSKALLSDSRVINGAL